MNCCDRLHPCAEAVALWEAVADAYGAWDKALRRWMARSSPRSLRARDKADAAYIAARDAYEAHFVETPVEQGVML